MYDHMLIVYPHMAYDQPEGLVYAYAYAYGGDPRFGSAGLLR